jgi:hypothetical protein
METVDNFIARTLKVFLILAGLATCTSLLLAYSADVANRIALGGLLEYGPSTVPALRHWGIMLFGIGALMVAAAFRPWLRFETILFAAIEKSFIIYLSLTNISQPWIGAYTTGVVVDSMIVAYCAVYFVSAWGRPRKWVSIDDRASDVRTHKAV